MATTTTTTPEALAQCKKGVDQLVQTALDNEAHFDQWHDVDHPAWVSRNAAYIAEKSQKESHANGSKWEKYPTRQPDDFDTGCIDSNQDNNELCRQQGVARVSNSLGKFWSSLWDNCSDCASASLACSGAFGHDKVKKRRCHFDFSASQNEYNAIPISAPEPGPEPAQPQSLSSPSIICQNCQNVINAVGNEATTVAANQVANCVASLTATSPTPAPAPGSSSGTGTPSTSTSTDNKKLYWEIAGGVLALCFCFVMVILVLLALSSDDTEE